ncbi:Yip1 family protein [Xylophilus ampelinus]|uniref:Uncharacterized protein DUF1282 n=1 Tax=Xylophilus ampelinus TaxID=54067 RepID=A0A318SKT2_9BURK|nr:Yip1 family protein [Xylophilus ampelinus]MCS4509338.1 YIP1 family protein [Xylophilus ampelinus]PYE79060.1 uncharacterized protein DUF1282 [Xylophilus ampelinus]
MDLVQRVQDILLKPQQTWPVIDAEPATPRGLYTRYLMLLALVPAVARFIGTSLVGFEMVGVSVRVPLLAGIVGMVVGYLRTLATVFLVALVVDALAPGFGGNRSRIGALKLVVYASTAALLGGIFSLLPALSVLGIVAALYTIYLLYTGLPVMMKCPPEKAGGYTAVVAICSIVAAVLVSWIAGLAMPAGLVAAGATGQRVMLRGMEGAVMIDTARMEEAARRMEEAGKRMEAAQASGDSAAAGRAAGEMMGALAGGTGPVIPADQLRAVLPETADGLPRESIEAQSAAAMGLGGSTARAVYRKDDRNVELSITDAGAAAVIGMAWSRMTLDRETADSVEKVYRDGKRTVREDYRKDKSHGEYTVMLENGIVVQGAADNVEIDDLRKAVKAIDMGRLESMQRPPKS